MFGGEPKTHQEQFMPWLLPSSVGESPPPFLLLNLIPVFCSPGPVYILTRQYALTTVMGMKTKTRILTVCIVKWGVDSTRCWDNRVIRDGPLVGLKVAEGTYQSSDSPIHTHYSLFKHLFSDSVHIPFPGSAYELDDKQFSQAKAIWNADINSNPLLILGVSYILPKGTIRPIYWRKLKQ